jgi:hypothetical protein
MFGRYLPAALFVASLAACGGDGNKTVNVKPDGTTDYPAGQTDFISGSPTGSSGYYGPGRGEDAENGAGGGAPTDGGSTPRTVEEADVVRLDGNTLYVLNQYRGLQIVDLTVRDQPHLLGTAAVRGYPVEMYIRNGRAYVITSNYYDFWYGVAEDGVQSFRGSLIVVIDVSNPASPAILGRIPVEGYVTDTRIVGDVLYAVSNRYAWYDSYATNDTTSETVVMSVDVSDPTAATVVDSEEFPLEQYGWDNHVFVTPTTIHVATPYYDYNGSGSYRTRLQEVDISDPAGQIVLRGSADVAGMVPSRWALDEYQGVLRVVTGAGWGNVAPALDTFAIGAGGTLAPLGHLALTLPRPESLTAVRFDGVRGYVVTYQQIDPLFLLDLTDPAAPVQRGSLEMPGWLDHVVPKGNRLVALGHDNSNPNGDWRLSVSLFDVTDIAAAPVLLDRVTFGASWGWVPDDVDERDKVFKVLDDIGLVMVPFHSYGFDQGTGYYYHLGGVQLVDYAPNDLVLRGLIEGGGDVRRALVAGDRLLTVSNEKVQVVNALNRDAPVITAEVDLARNVLEFARVNGVGVQLVGDWWSGDTRLVVVPLSDPDLGAKLAEVQVTAPYSRMFVQGNFVYLVSNDWQTQQATVRTVDFTVPTAPVVRGSVVLPFLSYWWYGWCWYYPWYYGGDEVAQVGDRLVFHVRPYSYWYYDDANGGTGTAPPDHDRLYVVDLSNPLAPAVASTIDLSSDMEWVFGLFAKGNVLHFSHYETAGQAQNGQPLVRFYLDRIDLTDPAHPVARPKVNVPGYVVGTSDDGLTAYTLDVTYWPSTDPSQPYDWSRPPRYTLNTLRLYSQVAVLLDRLNLNDTLTWVNQVTVNGSRAVWTGYRYWNDPAGSHYQSRLGAVDATDPTDLDAGTTLATPEYGWIQAFEGSRVFFNVGYPSGLAIYDVADADAIAMESFTPFEGWASQIRVYPDVAYVATGYWGVTAIELQ